MKRFNLSTGLLFVVLLGIILSLPGIAAPCFGPKLFVAADSSPRHQALYGLVCIYLKEKTGIETALVKMAPGQGPGLIASRRADLAISSRPAEGVKTLFGPDDLPLLLSGPRPLSDIQFSLVAPALEKLARLLDGEAFSLLTAQVAEGKPPLAAARAFLDGRGWL